MTNALKPIVGASFNEQAAYLVKDAMELIEGVLIKHSAAVLEEMRDQIVSRNKRIAELEAENAKMRETLEGIKNANWRTWEELAHPEEFVRWAQSRANHALQPIKKESER